MFVSNAQAAMRLQMSCASRVLGAAALRNGNGSTSFFSSSSSSSSSVSAEAAAVFESPELYKEKYPLNSLASAMVTTPMDVPQRVLMGPGPSNTHPRALAAMSMPQLGHMHPPFLKIMDEVIAGLQYIIQTSSPYTLAISGSGHAAMEAGIANVTEPGDVMVVGVNGLWGERVAELARRFGCEVVEMKTDAGKSFSKEEIKAAMTTASNSGSRPVRGLFLCQGESSTGAMQSLEGIGDICREHNALFMVDTVCSLGGVPFSADELGVDVMYSGAQKCLSAPPGASPFFMSERAMEVLQNRKTPLRTYNLDMKLIGDYWGWFGSRSYHHTAPVSNLYALREALAITNEEGVTALWARHKAMHDMLWDGLDKLGLEPFVEDPASRLYTVNTIKVPEGVDWKKLVDFAMQTRCIEIAGGLGPTVGKIWRIGIMGYNARPQNVAMTLEAFREGLKVARK